MPAPEAPRPLIGRFVPGLTGIRGLAALWVVVFHILRLQGSARGARGYLGVDAFFILSGFVLSMVYAGWPQPWTLRAHGRFLQARLARIYPLHVVTLVAWGVAFALVPAAFIAQIGRPGMFSAYRLLATLALVNNWGVFGAFGGFETTSWNPPTWSLSAEWLAYLAFPIFLLGASRVRSARLALGLAVGAILLLAAAFAQAGAPRFDHVGPHGGNLRMATEFAAGCLLHRATRLGFRIPPGIGQGVLAVLAALGAFGPRADAAWVLGFTVLVLLAHGRQGAAADALAHPAVVWLGDISFSLYLWHGLVQTLLAYALARFGLPAGLIWGALPIALGLAALSFTRIEVPARHFARALSTRPTLNAPG